MIYIGEDLGAGANKIYSSQGGMLLQAIVSADTSQAVNTALLGFHNRKPPLKLRIGGMTFFVGPGAHDWGRAIENLDYERMSGVPETRAIVYGILTRYMQKHGLVSEPIHMVVGLPLEPLSGEQAQANADDTRRWLLGTHSWEADGQAYQIEIGEVKVTSQPTGAMYDFSLDPNGQYIPERKAFLNQELGVISVGFNTVELLTISGYSIVQGMTTGRTSGVRRLLELVNSENLYTLGELDSKLRAGKLDVRAALPVWTREVMGQIEKTWGARWKRFSQTIIVGGGALLLRDAMIRRFNGRVFIPDDPVMSISRGLYKAALQQANRRKSQ